VADSIRSGEQAGDRSSEILPALPTIANVGWIFIVDLTG
jgi:hypothetical protein